MNNWRDNFKSYALRTNFQIGLTRPQMEMLCAVADNVEWDRFKFGGVNSPNNWIASEGALTKRGLIQRKKEQRKWKGTNIYEITAACELTEAGRLLVELLKVTGLFVESDDAIERRVIKANGKARAAYAR